VAEDKPGLVVEAIGIRGVNVDKNPLELDNSELTHAQNCVSDSSTGRSTIRKRPGLIAFNLTDTIGVVLGGIEVPLLNLSTNGNVAVYIARGPVP